MATNEEFLYVYREGDRGILPVQEGYSGVYLLFAPENFTIPPEGVLLLYLQIRVQVPPGYIGRLGAEVDLVRSGIFASAETVDPCTRWELKLILINHTPDFYYGRRGQAVGRLILHRVIYPVVLQATQV
ncbi:control protein E4orf1 [Simian adenovirus DM-2014]|uniref:Control protein E4orf1 n=1 Tax=Simian adenovirus DM-2014 TaxID=1560346 RepID=A0A097IWB4_9ADEN|nr:control protein E4orf1 [Simian adenovirus DM-2014]AIT71000.1 control protein E4orf1 [Simian adenovirus DM-2014]